MAKQTSLLTFTGRLGDLIGYRRKDGYFIRSMPQAVRQTTATRRAARRFGEASKQGRLIRSAFSSGLDVPRDGGHVNRLNKMLIAAGKNNPAGIRGFRFNQHAATGFFFTVAPTLSKNGTLRIPAQLLPQPKGISLLEVKVVAARIRFAQRRVTGTDTAAMYIDPSQPFEGASLKVEVPGEGTLVVTLQVRCFRDGELMGQRKYLAADIIAVMEQQRRQLHRKPAYPQDKRTESPLRMPGTCAIIQRE